MAKTVGNVTRIAINAHKVSVFLRLGEGAEKKLVLFSDKNAAVIQQVTLASRAWMLSMLQNAQVHKLPVIANHGDDNVITQLEVLHELALNFDFDFSGDDDETDKTKKPLPDGLKPPKPQRKRPQPA